MSRGAFAFAWISSIAVHAVAALLVIHAVPAREPAPVTKLMYIEPLGSGTGRGGEKTTAPVAPAPTPPSPPAVAPQRQPKPSITKPRPTPAKTQPAPAAPPAEPSGTATATASSIPGDGSGPGAGGGSPTGSPLGTPAMPPAVVTRVPPIYPASARESGVEGAVVLVAIVAADGRVEEPVRIARSIPALDGAAIAALHRWRFRPGRDASGRPVRAEVEVPIRFELR
jgi:periplasmic protein TonB